VPKIDLWCAERRGVQMIAEREQDPHVEFLTYRRNADFLSFEAGNRAAEWLARRTAGIAQSNVLEALGNIPTTAHVPGGAVIGADASSGVIDHQLRAFGDRNLLARDASAMPANPGVNPALTITALAEYAMTQSPRVSSAPQAHRIRAAE
jgi:cholesterol oxidase